MFAVLLAALYAGPSAAASQYWCPVGIGDFFVPCPEIRTHSVFPFHVHGDIDVKDDIGSLTIPLSKPDHEQ